MQLSRSFRFVPLPADFAAVLFLLLLPFIFFWRQTLGWLTLADADAIFWYYPAYQLVVEQLRQGQLPLWNPYLYGGMPLFGQWQAAVLDPLNWVFLFGVSERTLTFAQQLSFSVGLLGMYGYVRQLAGGRRAAVFAAIIYGLSGFAVARSIYPNILHIVVIAPWIFVFLERLALHRRWRDAALGVWFVAWQLFAAHPQPFLYCAVLAAAYALFRMQWRVASVEEWWRLNGRFALQAACVYFGGLCLSAVQLLPVAEIVSASVRQEWPYELFTLNSLHPVSLLGALFPFLHGQGNGIYHLPYWGPYWHAIEATIYLGGIALSFALVAAVAAWRQPPNAYHDAYRSVARFWSLVAFIAVLMAMGRYFPPLARVLHHVPVWGQFRSANRHFLEVTLAVAVLCGLLMQRCLDGADEQLRRWFSRIGAALVSVTLLVGAMGWWRPGWLQAWLRVLPDLHAMPPNFLRATQAEFFVPMLCVPLAVLAVAYFLRAPQRRYALLLFALLLDFQLYAHFAPINTKEKQLTERLGQGAAVQSEDSAGGRWHQMLPPGGGEFNPFWGYGHEFISGYDPLLNTRYKTFTRIDEAGRSYSTTLLSPEDKTLDLLNVRYVMLPPGYLAAQPATVNAAMNDIRRWRPVGNASRVPWYDAHQVYENLRAQPRAWLVGEVQVVTDWYQQLQRLRGESKDEQGRLFDPRRTAIAESSDAFAGLTLTGEPFATDSAKIVQRQAGRLLIDTDAAHPSLLVISEMAYPGWQVAIDGQAASWQRVNYMLCGVPLSAGKHRVEFFYRPASLKTGAIITFLTALILLGVMGWSFRFES